MPIFFMFSSNILIVLICEWFVYSSRLNIFDAIVFLVRSISSVWATQKHVVSVLFRNKIVRSIFQITRKKNKQVPYGWSYRFGIRMGNIWSDDIDGSFIFHSNITVFWMHTKKHVWMKTNRCVIWVTQKNKEIKSFAVGGCWYFVSNVDSSSKTNWKTCSRLFTYHLHEMALVAIIYRLSVLKLEFRKLLSISTEILLNSIFMD